jgi:4-hydroxyphenylpyruvate dioxygenase
MNLEGTTGDEDKIVADIKELGGLGSKENPPIRFAYEALAWGAHIDLLVSDSALRWRKQLTKRSRWQHAWRVVQRVNLPNVGTGEIAHSLTVQSILIFSN